MIKNILAKIIPHKIRKIIRNFRILAIEYGQYKTIKTECCLDKGNNKIPWYTYPAVEYLNSIDFTNKSVLEYGCGNSSFFWSRNAEWVVSIEHDKTWYERTLMVKNANQEIILCNDAPGYENPSEIDGRKFDVVIIDACRRTECAKVVKKYLDMDSEEGFMVILDNSDWYKNTAKYLRTELDLIEVDFHGFGPINNYTWTTSIFVSRNFRFRPKNDSQPSTSIAGIGNHCD